MDPVCQQNKIFFENKLAIHQASVGVVFLAYLIIGLIPCISQSQLESLAGFFRMRSMTRQVGPETTYTLDLV